MRYSYYWELRNGGRWAPSGNVSIMDRRLFSTPTEAVNAFLQPSGGSSYLTYRLMRNDGVPIAVVDGQRGLQQA